MPFNTANLYNISACSPGSYHLYIFFDGIKKNHRAVNTQLKYAKPDELAYTCPNFLCQLLGLERGDFTALDATLTRMLYDSCPQDGSLYSLLTPKNLATTAGTAQLLLKVYNDEQL